MNENIVTAFQGLADLAAFATRNNYTPSVVKRVPIYELSIEDARKKVKVRNGDKFPAENGDQALVLGFGRRNLPLDVVAKGATRINATKEQVEQFTNILLKAVEDGVFDADIVAVQAAAKAAAAEAAAKGEAVDLEEEEVTQPADGVDLSAL